MRMLRQLSLVAVLAIAIGCSRGGDGSSSTSSPSDSPDPTPARTVNPGQHGPTASGSFEFDGAFDASGEYSVLYPFFDTKTDECAELAAAEIGTYGLPLPTFLDEQRYTWVAALKEYKGPGTYDMEDLGRLTVEVTKDAKADPVSYVSMKGATATVKVNKKNGGSLEFEDLKSKDGDAISGTATWTCAEGSEGKT